MRVLPRNNMKPALLRSVSTAAMVVLASFATAAHAQLRPSQAVLRAPSIAPRAVPGQVRSVGATDALARQMATRTRAEQIRGFVTQARAVVRSAPNGLASSIVGNDGLVIAGNAGGLVPTARAREALAWRARAAALRAKPDFQPTDDEAAKAADQRANALTGQLLAVNDAAGRATWQGAALPIETINGDNRLVTIDQTESRAILSWDRFDVGAQTTLQFNQKAGGVAQKDWVAVNRVLDPSTSPSLILGSIVADGTVVVVNRNGMIFGSGAKVNTNSLLASSLDIGNFFKRGEGLVVQPVSGASSIKPGFISNTLQDRNLAFLQTGLFQAPAVTDTVAGMLVSAEGAGFVELPTNVGQLLANAPASAITVDRGASITAGKGGFVILAAPKLTNDGSLSAAEGQVSLQAGMAISHTVSTGATPATSAPARVDPNVRGIILRTPIDAAGSQVVNSGLIETQRGYASLGTSLAGSVENSGLIAATTSVSRNGYISLTGGSVTLAGRADPSQASGLIILPDQNGETIPQGTAAEPPKFKPSQIVIGGIYLDSSRSTESPLGELGPASITLGANSLVHAPNATVKIGGEAGQTYLPERLLGAFVPNGEEALAASKIDMADGALIDVSGVKDVALAASRNSLLIDPVKRNELRDTPNYREVATGGEFSLNGAAIYVDPRISGVRDDGVAYVGSPLIEAGSAASQIGVSAAELMTRGGSVAMAVAPVLTATSLELAPRVNVASGATIDLSGGWVTYAEGMVRTSRLLTADGRIINIGDADPNDRFVAVGDGFNEVQAKFGISRVYANSILQGARFEAGYDEGRDAGALSISAATVGLDGTLYGQAFAGVRQVSSAKRGSRKSAIAGDNRLLQSTAAELPSGASVYIGKYGAELGWHADIVVGNADSAAPEGAIHLDAAKLSSAGLSALSLRTTAGIEFAAGSKLRLADGGALSVEAGREIRFDGDVTAVSGSITARTIDFGAVLGVSGPSLGSPVRSDDDLPGIFSADPAMDPEFRPFDITVNGKLSAAGLWTNDFTSADLTGRAWIDGGSISLTVAPSAFSFIEGSNNAADLSGSIRIDRQALLDVSSGGYVATDGTFDFGAKGGNVSLINRTVYAAIGLTDTSLENGTGAKNPIGGHNQSVTFTPYATGEASVTFARTVETPRSEVSFEASSIKGFGFEGGGTFELVAPDIAMGSEPGTKGPRIGLDFLQRTGFGTLDLTAVKSRFVRNLFTNGIEGNSSFLETERFVVGANQTLDLTQTVLPQLLDTATRTVLSEATTGTDVTSLLTPGIPEASWDRKAAHLVLGGLTELEVAKGGSIVGAAEASITVPRLYNAGTIRIAGGSIVQNDTYQGLGLNARVVGVRDVAMGGGGLSDILGGGTAGQQFGFDENEDGKIAVFRDQAETQRLKNGELFSYVAPSGPRESFDVNVVFTGRVALNEGIHLTGDSTTDLSGVALYNPRASVLANGRQQRVGRVVAGGAIATSSFGSSLAAPGYGSPIDPSNRLVAEAGAKIALDGASGVYDQRVSSSSIAAVAQWSDGGKLVVGNGAQLTGAHVSAFGGDDGDADLTKTRATGGLLDWLAPTIRQTDDGSSSDASNLYASQVMAAGFDSLVVRREFTTVGKVDLTLGKSFIATTDAASTVGTVPSSAQLTITAKRDPNDPIEAPDSIASITAPYIRLASSAKAIGFMPEAPETGSLSLSAKAMDIVGTVVFRVGDSTKGAKRGRVRLEAAGDIRLIGTSGVPNPAETPSLSGQLVSNGDLLFKSAQVYATTGTGNLQQLLEDRRALKTPKPDPYVIASTNAAGIVRFERQEGAIPDTPYSAGSYLRVLGANIVQNGVLRAPLGLLEIGANGATPITPISPIAAPATQSLSFGQTSFTSVSARVTPTGTAALDIPYGTTTDLIEYYFNPSTINVLTTTPMGELRLAGKDIVISDGGNGVRIDGRGGGDVFAYEFIPGTGGSRDILDRLNPDLFSGTKGLQFPDGRQVFAILPKNDATAALFDPVYSADYFGGGGINLYGADAGLTVRLDGAPGIPAGDYLLLPAHYALLPGAMRIVENVGAATPFAGGATELLDGSLLIGGVYGTAGTELVQSQRRSFTVQTQDVIAKYSRIETTSGTETVTDLAEHKGLTAPLLPRDAARVVLSPLTSLKVAGAFSTDAAAGGLGSRVDIGGKQIRIAAPGATAEAATADYLLLTTDTLTNFKANSLSIGALRNENTDGTTTLDVIANTILVDNDVRLSAPELLLSVGGPGSLLQIKDAARGKVGAVLTATGLLADSRFGDYIVNATAPRDGATGEIDQTGAGAVLRISTGPERLISREGDFAVRNSLLPARLDIGAGAEIRANSITLDSSRGFAIDRTVKIGALTESEDFTLAVSGDLLRVGGANFRPEIEAEFGKASRFTLRSPDTIYFVPGAYHFKDLTIDAPGIGLAQPAPTAQQLDVELFVEDLELRNSSKDRGGCKGLGQQPCFTGSLLRVDASTITFGNGTFRASSFYTRGDDIGNLLPAVTLAARNGMFVSGKGEFSLASFDGSLDAALRMETPFIVDRTTQSLLGDYARPDYKFTAPGALTIAASTAVAAPTDQAAPGAHIAFAAGSASGEGITVENAVIRATAGTLDLTAQGSIMLQGTASLQTPGFTKTFSDGVGQTIVSASGGAINLALASGILDAGAQTSLIVDNGIGKAGVLNISAPVSEVLLLSQLNSGIAANLDRSASFRLDAGSSEFDLSAFVTNYGRRFQGEILVRSGVGDLNLLTGQTIKADSVSLIADGGEVLIAGTIDTSGDRIAGLALTDTAYREARVDGGAISLFGREGVSLLGTASLTSTTSGYNALDTRQASGGKVTIGIGIPELADAPAARIDIASGAIINVSALNTGDRLVSKTVTDPNTQIETAVYHMAPGDQGGLVNFRAPVLDDNSVNFSNRGRIDGARELSVEGYRRFDLDAIERSGIFSGISVRNINGNDYILLDPSASITGVTSKANFLTGKVDPADPNIALGSIPDFIRNFSITGPNEEKLTGYRLRPGVELSSAGNIQLQADWNLGAGTIDIEAALKDPEQLLVPSVLGTFKDGPLAGQTAYEVAYGAESRLFTDYVDMLYRVDGSVRGEAPVISFRAAQDLNIKNSITDGFFTFHDKTNSDYINYQLGGGDRTYNPALNIGCGADGSCEGSVNFADVPPSRVATNIADRVTIVIGNAQQGTESSPLFIQAPFNPLANAASPIGTGDALGVAELFPLLSDGSAVHSSSIQLVGGALTGSANPLQVGAASPFTDPIAGGLGSVTISGEKSFNIAPTSGATARLDGSLQIGFGATVADREFFSVPDLLQIVESGENLSLQGDFYTVLTWGVGTTGAAASARDRAKAFSAFSDDRFLGPKNNPTGVQARLSDVIAFLAESGFGDDFAQNVSNGTPGYNTAPVLAAPIARLQRPTAFVGTKVRTGDGSIDIAAANNIDLRRTGDVVLRRNPGENSTAGDTAQVGGTAVYTAGVRAAPADLYGAVLPNVGAPNAAYVPGPTSGVAVAPVFAKDGGSVTLTAGQDVLGRRDYWNERFGENGSPFSPNASPIFAARGYAPTQLMAPGLAMFGSNAPDQRWRFGATSTTDTMASLAFNYFTSGVGALSGGDVSIRAGRDLSDMTIALDNSLVTGKSNGVQTLVKLGNGNLFIDAGRNIVGGQYDIASGVATAKIGGDVISAGRTADPNSLNVDENLLRVRIADAVFNLSAKGGARIGGIGSLGLSSLGNYSAGFFSTLAGVSIDTIEQIRIVGNRSEQIVQGPANGATAPVGYVLPPSLSLTTIGGDIDFADADSPATLNLPRVMYGSEYGQLRLLSAGDIAGLALAMSDAAPANMFGIPSPDTLRFPRTLSDTPDSVLRLQHDRHILHRDDFEPVRIVAGGSINDVVLSLPKAARIRAESDIIDLQFYGQNVRVSDLTKISAGRDITGTVGLATGVNQGRSGVLGNNIVLGGPGALFVEAGRDLGPFVTSATGLLRTEAGGIRTVGNEQNPWLPSQGADIYALFGIAQGVDYAALERVYLDPANLAQLDGDLFEQNADSFGNKTSDRSRYSYAPVLAEWLRENHPDAFATVFGDASLSGDALKQQSYARYADLYEAFAGIDESGRNRFLIDKLYFGELQSPSDPNSQSFNQFIRGYRAVQTLFSPERGYTDNLATYETDPSTINADNPLGVPTKILVNGEPAVADVKLTGNVDLRLSTLGTARGGDVTILGPGGNFVAGSVVRTEAQRLRRVTALNVNTDYGISDLESGNYLGLLGSLDPFTGIPSGYEGILTLRGGEVRGFTDGSFVLNQSRLFTQAGGDITLWSSNGDLNAGQGPRSSSNFPPIVLRFSPNGLSEVNSAGSVSGAGIGAFKSSPDDPEASIRLIAPVGTVDAGDAGVRASGSIFVAAARVANADNFTAGGTLSGVPSATAPAAPPVPASAASAIVANAVRAATLGDNADRLSRIFVDVLGYFGSDSQDCPEGQSRTADGECK